ncbi:hypothetical protein MASR2M117_25670 [Paludibacter sp.]
MLQSKKISKNIISELIDEIDEDEYKNTIQTLAAGKLRKITYKNDFEKSAKLYRYLVGKGFEADVVSDIIRSI